MVVKNRWRNAREKSQTIGGLTACRLYTIVGVLAGTSERAARDLATPIVSNQILAEWATEQASLIAALHEDPTAQMECATVVRRCGGKTLDLPIARHAGSYLSFNQIASMSLPDEIFIASPYTVHEYEELNGFELVPNLFLSEFGSWMSILQTSRFNVWPDNPFSSSDGPFSFTTTLGGILVEAIAQSWGASVVDILRQATDKSQHRDERIIGYLNSQEIKKDVLVISKASTT